MTIKYGCKHVLCNVLVAQWLVSSGDRGFNPHSANLFLSLRFQKPHTLAPLVIWTHGTTGGFSISHHFQFIGGGSFRVWQDCVYYEPFTEQYRIISYQTLLNTLLLQGVARRVSTHERTGGQAVFQSIFFGKGSWNFSGGSHKVHVGLPG